MTEQTLIRLAMILQDRAPSTLNKYICRLAESVLYDFREGLTLTELSTSINMQFNLTFTPDEIENAIKKKGNRRIIIHNGHYQLLPETIKYMEETPSLISELENYVSKFIDIYPTEYSIRDIISLLTNFFYECFNKNVDNLLSLFNKKEKIKPSVFSASNEEIAIINAFITWDDAEKDKFVYGIVSVCYEYCMLTIKKDNILSKELFRGKRFYLDANIIFRMAGVNNSERQFITQDFIRRCHDVGIDLYYTSSTLEEVFRVITNQVNYIRGVAGYSMPVSSDLVNLINLSQKTNDFYKLYYEWCISPGNKCGDYTSFQRHLVGLVQSAIKNLQIKQSTSYKATARQKEFEENSEKLREYKNNRRVWRYTSKSSSETDINNVFDVLEWRKKNGISIWQTNDFLVSADHLLIDWAESTYSGIPIVVLPSVWLSIILRFSGRTDDDYKSFCLFLTQRQHIDKADVIDPAILLKEINEKTDNIDIKSQIVWEISQNKTEYSFDSQDEYSASVDRAFDKILQDVYGKKDQEIDKLKEEMSQRIKALEDASKEESAQRSAETIEQKTKWLLDLTNAQTNKKVGFFVRLKDYKWIAYFLAGSIVVAGVCIWAFEINPLYSLIISILPSKVLDNPDSIGIVITVISSALGLFCLALGALFNYLGGDSRREKLFNRLYKKNARMLPTDDN